MDFLKWYEKYLPDLKSYFGVFNDVGPRIEVKNVWEDYGPYYNPFYRLIVLPPKCILDSHGYKTIFDKYNAHNMQPAVYALAHEYQHHVQSVTGRLNYITNPKLNGNDHVIWEGERHKLVQTGSYCSDDKLYQAYLDQPWEAEANTKAIDFCRTFNYTR